MMRLFSAQASSIRARVPMQMRRFRLECAAAADAKWLCNLMNELGKRFGTAATLDQDNSVTLVRR